MVKSGIINASAWIFSPLPLFFRLIQKARWSPICVSISHPKPLCRGALCPEPPGLPCNRRGGRYRWIRRWTNHNASLNALMSGEENKSLCIAMNQWAFNLVFVTPITISSRDQASVAQPWRPRFPPLGFELLLTLIGQPNTTACDSIKHSRSHIELPAIIQEKFDLFVETNEVILQKRFALLVKHTLSCNIGITSHFQTK